MREIPREPENLIPSGIGNAQDLLGLIDIVREPLLVLYPDLRILFFNEAFRGIFEISDDLRGLPINLFFPPVEHPDLYFLLETLLPESNQIKDFEIGVNFRNIGKKTFSLNLAQMRKGGDQSGFIVLSFKEELSSSARNRLRYRKTLRDILDHAPASVCVLKGPAHVFEVANPRYLELVGHRDIIGKSVREVLPEVESQGFIAILDKVFETGKPFLGNEVELNLTLDEGKRKISFVDFLYQPTWNSGGEIDGIFVHAVDVTEKVVVRTKLEKSKRRLKSLIDTIPAIVWLSDSEGQISYLNINWFKYTGQTEADAYKGGWTAAVHPSHREKMLEVYKTAQRDRKNFSVNFKIFYHKTGKYRWVLNNGRPKYDSEGKYEGMVGTLIDVHEEKLKEKLVREKEHRVRSIVEEATVATAVYVGRNMRIELANDAMLELWGKNRSVIGKNLRDALPELEGQPFHQLLGEVFQTGKTYWAQQDKVDLEIGNKLQTGYFNFTYKPLRNEQGEIYGILNMALDVTDMVESKAMLKVSETHFRQMADLMPEKVANTDARGNFNYFNQGWLDFTGKSIEELISEGWEQFIHPEERADFSKNWQQALLVGDYFEMELRCLDLNGNYRWHLSRAEAVRDEDGKVKMWIGNNTDIQRLKEEEKSKEDFLKMVSHELKTPVTSIQGYVQLLLKVLENDRPMDTGLLQPSLERMDHQLKRLRRLISEMLDLTRVEEDKLELQKSRFSLNQLVDETVQDIQRTNTRHGIRVLHNFEGDVFADKDRIGQVLINLVTNAIKYSPERQEVEVRVEQNSNEQISVFIKDEGIGINPKSQRDIFKRFYRAGMKQEETYAGFGIGLYLANEIINRHKGIISVKSELGQGSEFFFTLELANNQEQ